MAMHFLFPELGFHSHTFLQHVMMAAAVVAAFSSPAKARRWMLEGALQRPLSMAVRTAALVYHTCSNSLINRIIN